MQGDRVLFSSVWFQSFMCVWNHIDLGLSNIKEVVKSVQVDEVVYRKCVNENVRGQKRGKQHHLREKQWKKKEPRKGVEMIWQKKKKSYGHRHQRMITFLE